MRLPTKCELLAMFAEQSEARQRKIEEMVERRVERDRRVGCNTRLLDALYDLLLEAWELGSNPQIATRESLSFSKLAPVIDINQRVSKKRGGVA